MRSAARVLGLCVCVCVRAQSSTAGYEAPYERYQWIQNDKVGSCKKAIVSKGLRSRDMVVPYPPPGGVGQGPGIAQYQHLNNCIPDIPIAYLYVS